METIDAIKNGLKYKFAEPTGFDFEIIKRFIRNGLPVLVTDKWGIKSIFYDFEDENELFYRAGGGWPDWTIYKLMFDKYHTEYKEDYYHGNVVWRAASAVPITGFKLWLFKKFGWYTSVQKNRHEKFDTIIDQILPPLSPPLGKANSLLTIILCHTYHA